MNSLPHQERRVPLSIVNSRVRTCSGEVCCGLGGFWALVIVVNIARRKLVRQCQGCQQECLSTRQAMGDYQAKFDSPLRRSMVPEKDIR